MPGLVCLITNHDRLHHPGGVVRHGDGGRPYGLAREQGHEPQVGSLLLTFHAFYERRHAHDEQRSKVFVTHLGDTPKPLFAAIRMLPRRQARLAFYDNLAHLADRRDFQRHLAPVWKKNWVVYAKPPFAGSETVLAYVSRYTHRVAISNSQLLRFGQTGVTFRYKSYRADDANRQQVTTLSAHEFIRRFLLHVLPKGFHRIRHYGLLAGATRKAHLERAREMLGVAPSPVDAAPTIEPDDARPPCPCCGGRMLVIETFERWRAAHRRRMPPRPGPRRHDPAWPDRVPPRVYPASGVQTARAGNIVNHIDARPYRRFCPTSMAKVLLNAALRPATAHPARQHTDRPTIRKPLSP